MTLYLTNALWLDPAAATLRETALAVDRGPLGAVTPVERAPAGAASLDCQGMLVTRALACGHHHVYSALARGMPPALHAPSNFTEILKNIWWRLDRRLDRDMIEASALATACACAQCGVTFVVDHHSSPNAVGGSLGLIARAFDRVGLGHLLCYEIGGRDGPDAAQAGLEETDAYLGSGRRGHVGLHASFTVDDELLGRAVDLARAHGAGIHMHAAEDASDQEHCRAAYGKRVIERLKDAGVLDVPGTILAHCIHLDQRERELLRASSAWVAQNTQSNQNNAVGLGTYADLGPRVMLGTDGMHSDMLSSLRASYLAGQATEGLSPRDALRRLRATHALAAFCAAPGGGDNHLVVLDYDTPTDVTPDNFAAHAVYGLDARHVRHVVAQGRVIVRDRRLESVDEAEVLAFAREQARRLWDRLRDGRP